MMKIPKPNTIVSVTTKYHNYNYYSKDKFQYFVRIGKVLKNPKWIRPDSFCISTDNPKFPMSIINMNYVVSLEEMQ